MILSSQAKQDRKFAFIPLLAECKHLANELQAGEILYFFDLKRT